MKVRRFVTATFALVLLAALVLMLVARGPDAGGGTPGERVGHAIDSTQAAISNASWKTAQAVDTAATAVIEARRSVGDAAITASIKTDLLKDPDLSALKIEVDTHQGVVTLNGVAPHEAAADRAARIAVAVAGVKDVRNHVVPRKG